MEFEITKRTNVLQLDKGVVLILVLMEFEITQMSFKATKEEIVS